MNEPSIHGETTVGGGISYGTIDPPRPDDAQGAIESLQFAQAQIARITRPSDDQTDPMIGHTLGKYQILSKLGQGGMGTVYRALQTRPVRREVALKLMGCGVIGSHVRASTQAHRRFIAEGQVLAAIRHNDIACVFDADTTAAGEPFLVMELARGVPLSKYCREVRATLEERIELVLRISRAVHHAHTEGIVHRDLKPDNILVDKGDDGPTIKIIDFGIAKVLDGHESIASGMTAMDQFIGTPGYLSPEQARGSDVDARADVFSLGAILFQLICGNTPINRYDTPFQDVHSLRNVINGFESPRPSQRLSKRDAETKHRLAQECQSTVHSLMHQCRNDLDWVVIKALAQDRTNRYATASDFADDLQRVLDDQPTRAAAPTWLYRAKKFRQRHPMLVAGMFLTLIAVAAILARWQYVVQESKLQTRMVNQHCNRILDQVETLRVSIHMSEETPQSHLTRAAVLLEQAQDMLDREPSLVTTHRRQQELLGMLQHDEQSFDFVSRLDLARQMTTVVLPGQEMPGMGSDAAIATMRETLVDFGIDPNQMDPQEAAFELSRLPMILVPHVIESLDFWIGEVQPNSPAGATTWQCRVLQILDPDPERNRLRRAIVFHQDDELESILASGMDARQLPFSRIQLAGALAGALSNAGKPTQSIAILRRAQQDHPDDFWVNHHLATELSNRGDDESMEEALRFFTVATALRPDSPGPSINLAMSLASLGRHKDAWNEFERIQSRHPESTKWQEQLTSAIELALSNSKRQPKVEDQAGIEPVVIGNRDATGETKLP